MPEAHKRVKDPQAVRRRLMDEAKKLAIESGISAITVQAVASAAGVTKGGFLHHFPVSYTHLTLPTSDLV